MANAICWKTEKLPRLHPKRGLQFSDSPNSAEPKWANNSDGANSETEKRPGLESRRVQTDRIVDRVLRKPVYALYFVSNHSINERRPSDSD